MLSYKDVVFSVTRETPTTGQPENPKSVSPPTGQSYRNTKVRNQRHSNRSLQHRPGFNFPYKTLVIAADATPRNIGGYVINHFSKRVEFYSVPASRMPWILRNTTRSGNPTEFEMKNLLCALLIWEEKIVRHRKVAIFTDNSAIIGNSLYGSRVRSFIHHLQSCKQVLHVNPRWTFLNSKESPEVFNEFIVPADHLSRLNEPEFRAHIISYHYDFHEGEISQSNFNAVMTSFYRNLCDAYVHFYASSYVILCLLLCADSTKNHVLDKKHVSELWIPYSTRWIVKEIHDALIIIQLYISDLYFQRI